MPNDARICVTGNLIKDPVTSVVNNQTVVQFTIAANTTLKKADGSGYESNFYNVSVWGKPGEWLLEKIQKGTSVDVVGALVLQKYTNKQTGQEGQSLNIRAFDVIPRARTKQAATHQGSIDPVPNEPDHLPF